MSESYANHVLNRALPSARLLKQKMAGIDVKPSGMPRRRAPMAQAGPLAPAHSEEFGKL